MAANTSSRVTTDHDAIRRWAEERGAKPVLASKSAGKPASIRLELPGSRDPSLQEIGWDEWFQRLNKGKLALLYQQQTADGERSSFCEIVPCEKADEVEQAVGGRGRSATRRGKPRESKSVRLHPAGAGTASPAKNGVHPEASENATAKTSHPHKPATKHGRGKSISST